MKFRGSLFPNFNKSEVIPCLSNLRDLSIRISPWFPIEIFMPILNALIQLFRGRTLEQLSLDVDYFHMAKIVPAFTTRWFKKPITIQHLRLVFPRVTRTSSRPDAPLVSDEDVRKGYRRHPTTFFPRHQITSLSMIFPRANYFPLIFHNSSYLIGLKLSKLDIRAVHFDDRAVSFFSFLESQRDSLKDLTVRRCGVPTCQESSTVAFGWHNLLEYTDNLPLPHLKTLDLCTVSDRQHPLTIHFPLSPNVTSLSLADVHYPAKSVEALLPRVMTHIPKLKHLTLGISSLGPDVLDILAGHLAVLNDLSLHLKLPHHYTPADSVYDKVYSRWQMKRLTVTRACSHCQQNTSLEEQVFQALARCFPLVGVLESPDYCQCSGNAVLAREKNGRDEERVAVNGLS